MVEEDAAEGVTGYIKHHLTHLTVNVGQGGGFWALHLDSVFFTLVLAFVLILLLSLAARRATSGVPGKFQAAVELLVEFVDDMVKDTFHGSNKFIAPLAITIFCLVFLENFMDILPGRCAAGGRQAVRRRASAHGGTADINTTVGMALGVFLLIQYIGIREKGVGVFVGEWFTAPVSRSRHRSQGAAGADQFPVSRDRGGGAAAFPVDAIVRQHVRRRAHIPADRLFHARRDARIISRPIFSASGRSSPASYGPAFTTSSSRCKRSSSWC